MSFSNSEQILFDPEFEEKNTCLVCESSRLKMLPIKDREGYGVKYSQCLDCRLVFASTYFSDKGLGSFYNRFYKILYPNHVLSKKKRKKLVDRLKEVAKTNGLLSVLDFGCGDGVLLDQLAPFFPTLLGVEFGKSFTTDNGVEVVPPEIFFSENDQKFDLIVLSQVLEHVQDPVDCLRKLVKFLSADGVIVVEVPGIFSLGNLRDHVRFLEQFKLCHKTYFSGVSLARLGEKTGLSVLHFDDSARVYLTRDSVSGRRDFMVHSLDPIISDGSLSSGQRIFLLCRVLIRKATEGFIRRVN